MSNAKTLQQFYSHEQGQKFRWFLQTEIEQNWQVADDEKILGLGFAAPYKNLFKNCKNYIDNSDVTLEETQLPIRNSELSRVFAIHFLENSASPLIALEEIWRALEPDGKFMLIVPNINSMWKKTAIIGRQNYEQKQIRDMLIASKFSIRAIRQNIFYPPEMKSELTKVMNKYFPFFGAVTIYYSEKLIFQSRGRTLKVSEGILDKLMPKKNIIKAQ